MEKLNIYKLLAIQLKIIHCPRFCFRHVSLGHNFTILSCWASREHIYQIATSCKLGSLCGFKTFVHRNTRIIYHKGALKRNCFNLTLKHVKSFALTQITDKEHLIITNNDILSFVFDFTKKIIKISKHEKRYPCLKSSLNFVRFIMHLEKQFEGLCLIFF